MPKRSTKSRPSGKYGTKPFVGTKMTKTQRVANRMGLLAQVARHGKFYDTKSGSVVSVNPEWAQRMAQEIAHIDRRRSAKKIYRNWEVTYKQHRTGSSQ